MVYRDCTEIELPEIVNLSEAQAVQEAIYIDEREFHRLDDHRILRYDLTLPLLIKVRFKGQPMRLWAAGKAYRHCQADATHLEAFHQAEVLWMDERERIDAWDVAGRVLKSMNLLMPGSICRIMPTQYEMCTEAWELAAERDAQTLEVLAWGVYAPKIIRHLGGVPIATPLSVLATV